MVAFARQHSANNFAAWDRFGRVLDQLWADYGSNLRFGGHEPILALWEGIGG
jgi:hypothetical protein